MAEPASLGSATAVLDVGFCLVRLCDWEFCQVQAGLNNLLYLLNLWLH